MKRRWLHRRKLRIFSEEMRFVMSHRSFKRQLPSSRRLFLGEWLEITWKSRENHYRIHKSNLLTQPCLFSPSSCHSNSNLCFLIGSVQGDGKLNFHLPLHRLQKAFNSIAINHNKNGSDQEPNSRQRVESLKVTHFVLYRSDYGSITVFLFNVERKALQKW